MRCLRESVGRNGVPAAALLGLALLMGCDEDDFDLGGTDGAGGAAPMAGAIPGGSLTGGAEMGGQMTGGETAGGQMAGGSMPGGSMGGAQPGERGVPCTPFSDEMPCVDGECLPNDDEGGGECMLPCLGPDDPSCEAPYQCAALPLGENDEDVWYCLPNADCGDLDFQGMCDGDTLVYCGFTGPESVDCTELADEGESPYACRFVSDDYGYDCMPEGFDGGCGDVSIEGSCIGNVLHFCESFESGEVITLDCDELDMVCQTDGEGYADCLPDGSMGCGTVTAQGTCDDGVAVYCDEDFLEVVRDDCTGAGDVCRLGDEGFRCLSPVDPGGEGRITGNWVFEKRPLGPNGYGALIQVPVRYATVVVLDQANQIVAQGQTDEQGDFSIAVEAEGPVRVSVTAQAATARHALSVRDCPQSPDGSNCNVYGVSAAPVVVAGGTDIGQQVVPADDPGGAFNIFDQFVTAYDFSIESFGERPSPITVLWAPGANTLCNTSCYGRRNIYILGVPQDTDEYDDAVLLHEFGHFVEDVMSRSDSPGGFHDGRPTDPRLAWGEGYGTYFGGELADSSEYYDGNAGGVMRLQLDNDHELADPDDPRGIRQLARELMVGAILWKTSRGADGVPGLGAGAVFDVLGAYFVEEFFADRGVEGVDLVDFLDGLICRGHPARMLIDEVVIGTHQFPYEYGGIANCQ